MKLRILSLLLPVLLVACDKTNQLTENSNNTNNNQTNVANNINNNQYYVSNNANERSVYIAIYGPYKVFGREDDYSNKFQENIKNKAKVFYQEYQQSGKLDIRKPKGNDKNEWVEFYARLSAIAELGYFVRNNNIYEPDFKVNKDGVVIQAEKVIESNQGFQGVYYSYWENEPVVASTYYRDNNGERHHQLFMFTNQWELVKGDGNFPLEEYKDCKKCTEEAKFLLSEKERVIQGTTQEYYVNNQSSNGNVISIRNVVQLLKEGMEKNTLILHYDEKGFPVELIYGYGNDEKSHNYMFSFKNGKAVSAEASTVFKKDSQIYTEQTLSQSIKFDENETIVKNEFLNGKSPEKPIDEKTWRDDVARIIQIAKQYRGN